MKYGFVKTAVCTPQIRPGATGHNKTEIIKAVRTAAAAGAELVVFGRLTVSGATSGNMFLYGTLLQGCIDSLMEIAADAQSLGSVLLLGLPFKFDNKIYDCTAVAVKGRIAALVPNYNPDPVFSEFPGDRLEYIKINDVDVPFGRGIVFYNSHMGYSFKLAESDMLPPCEIVIDQPLAAMYAGSAETRRGQAETRAKSESCCYIDAGCCKGESVSGRVLSSYKAVAEPDGILIDAGADKDMIMTEIDAGGISHMLTACKRPESFTSEYITVDFRADNNDKILTRKFSRKPLCPAAPAHCEEMLDIAATAIKTRMTEIGAKNVILGLSGGLDSSVVLLAAYRLFKAEKLPLENIIAVTMNAPASGKRTAKNARRLIELLNVRGVSVPIAGSLKRHMRDIAHEQEDDNVYENAQARERAQILLDLGNKYNALVLGTGDLSENALGWSTYGGDQLAHFNPNGGFTKTAVREIMRHHASVTESKELARVIKDILATPVSPELKPNQQTEKTLGPYEIHDFFLNCLIVKGYGIEKTLYLSELTFGEIRKVDLPVFLKTFVDRFFRNRFKQNFACDTVNVTAADIIGALSRIRSDFRNEQWMNELNNYK